MGTLKSQYEVSIWKDIWQGDKFKEQRICTIGSSEMESQSQIIDPILTRNTNGQKQFSFKMYTQYIDNISGKKVTNPFCALLTNETKVKLHYKGKWHDFVVKNISKTLANYECTYQLEDALVQELSKNGYDFAFNEYNNIGTAADLAREALQDTDWNVESEAFVERVEEHLVYVKAPKGATITKVEKPADKNSGATPGQTIVLDKDQIVMAFYSSCTTRPHRFQFIYLPDNQLYENVPTDDKQLIDTDDIQYYFDVDIPTTGYHQVENTSFYLPNYWYLSTDFEGGVALSLLYRGGRYGYSILANYLSKLNRYCNRYKVDGQEYYGYVESEYISPALATNFVTNNDFKDTSGWSTGYVGRPGEKNRFLPEITTAFGEFSNRSFTSVIDSLKNGNFELKEELASYLYITFPPTDGDSGGYIINSGFYDNRTQLAGLEPGEEWTLYLTILDAWGDSLGLKQNFDIGLYAIDYNPYTDYNNLTLVAGVKEYIEGGVILSFAKGMESIPKQGLTDINYKLIIKPKSLVDSTAFYISQAELFKNYYDENGNILPMNELSTEGIVNNDYVLFSEEEYDKCTSRDDLIVTTVKEKEFSYATYKPQYSSGCERIRSLAVEKSNYFNILQSIAETFECWVDLDVKNRAADGAITDTSTKVVRFKNYIGEANYAPLRYGLNVTDITRTFESKQIVTKLIVEPNVNELAKNGYCTISRAPSNPLGEDIIYDFQYFFSQKMLKQSDYEAAMYYSQNPITKENEMGADIRESDKTTNLQNYYNRIKALNVKLQPINEEITSLSQDISKLKATEVTEEKLIEAAEQGIEDAKYSIYSITGTSPEKVALAAWDSATCDLSEATNNKLNGETKITATLKSSEPSQAIDPTAEQPPSWTFSVNIADSGEYKTIQENFSVSKGTSSPYSFTFGFDNQSFPGYRYNASVTIKNEGSASTTFTLKPLSGDLENVVIKVGGQSSQESLNVTLNKNSTCDVEIIGDYNKFEVFDKPSQIGFTCDKASINAVAGSAKIKQSPWALFSLMSTDVFFTPTITCVKYSDEGNNEDNEYLTFSPKVTCTIPARQQTGECSYVLEIANLEDQSLISYLTEYTTCLQQLEQSKKNLAEAQDALKQKEDQLETATSKQQVIINQKKTLHKLFYKTYSRFIMEGTWKNDEYIDDNKYYTDSLSVLYNSCYPKAAYDIKIISLNGLPGYELFNYQLGETAYVEDAQFFGTSDKVEVIITGTTENLEDPSKDAITVQNFKNQFQDLFQKMAATVQQTNYNTGSYEKAVALAESDAEARADFISTGLSATDSSFSIAGQDAVVQDIEGITLTDPASRKQLKIMGTGILAGSTDPKTGVRVWEKILSPDGISAASITTGSLSTSEVSIMNGSDPTFRWDKFGISAFDADWAGATSSKPNPYQFVRFDKYGIYGIKSTGQNQINGTTWKPNSIQDIDSEATFSLTWSGLKVTGNDGVEARFGRYGANIVSVTKNNNKLLTIDNDGNLSVNGTIVTNEGRIANWVIGENSITTGEFGKSKSFHMYSSGYTTTDAGTKDKNGATITYFGQEDNKTWALGIGQYFGVTNEGKLYASDGAFTGTIKASGGEIGGWTIKEKSLVKYAEGKTALNATITSDEGFIQPSGCLGTYTVAGKTQSGWALVLGPNFGVHKDGTLYASAGCLGSAGSGVEITSTGIGTYKAGTSTNSAIASSSLTATVVSAPTIATMGLALSGYTALLNKSVNWKNSATGQWDYWGEAKIIIPAFDFNGDPGEQYYVVFTSSGNIGVAFWNSGSNSFEVVKKLSY